MIPNIIQQSDPYEVVGEILQYFDSYNLATWAPIASIIERERENTRLQIMEEAAKDLNARANVLRTPAGWIAAEWHEHDAAMVANELDRIAAALRTNHRVNEGGGDDIAP